MKKPHTIDAQELKSSLMEVAKKIGKRKRLAAGKFFELLLDCVKK